MNVTPPDDRTHDVSPDERERILLFESVRPGALFADRYLLGKSIGAGGAGEVFHAYDTVAGLDVALKVLFPSSGHADVDRLRRELQLARGLTHPGILRVFDMGFAHGMHFFVAELLDGETLRDRLHRRERLDVGEIALIARDVLDALAAAHDRGVIHRDVKPANIFLARCGTARGERAVLLDFGLARTTETSAATTVGRFLGTPDYAAPEQVRGDPAIGPAADLYSFGVTLWEMLTGNTPFAGTSDVETLAAHLSQTPRYRELAATAAPATLRRAIQRLLDKSPAARPRSAREALALLEGSNAAAQIGLLLTRARDALASRAVGTAAGIVLVAGMAALGLLRPVTVAKDLATVRWSTFGGVPLTRTPSSRAVGAVQLAADGFGLFRTTWVAFAPPASPSRPGGSLEAPVIGTLSSPMSPLRTLVPDVGSFYAREIFPGIDAPFAPNRLTVIEGARREEGAIALCSIQGRTFSTAIDLFRNDGREVATIYHSGHVKALQPWRANASAPLHVLGVGVNNAAGLRPVVFSIPADRRFLAQAPPYVGRVQAADRAPGWYLFLPFVRNEGLTEIVNSGEAWIARLDATHAIAFDPATGVPIDAAQRGGLGPDAWRARRDLLMDRLWSAARHAEASQPAAGAAELEEFAAREGGSPEMFSIALQRAAELRLRSAATGGAGAFRAALADVSRARSFEPAVISARCLTAELEARLGLIADARRTIESFGMQPEEKMYANRWLLADALAGFPVDPARFDVFWSGRERDNGDELPVFLAAAMYRNQHEAALSALEGERRGALTGPRQRYWAARVALDAPRAHPDLALRFLADCTENEGYPLRTARLAARALGASFTISRAELAEAQAEVRELERAAPTDLEAAVLVRHARTDLRRAEAVAARALPEGR